MPEQGKVGKVVKVIGPVLDIEFEGGHLPAIFNAIRITSEGYNIPEPLDVIVEVQQHLGEGRVRALHFADGTVIALAAGTKGRLAAVDGHGAHVAISDGAASVNVVPKVHARWQVDAGPFVIHVHGTVFTAAWNEAQRSLTSVAVSGVMPLYTESARCWSPSKRTSENSVSTAPGAISVSRTGFPRSSPRRVRCSAPCACLAAV